MEKNTGLGAAAKAASSSSVAPDAFGFLAKGFSRSVDNAVPCSALYAQPGPCSKNMARAPGSISTLISSFYAPQLFLEVCAFRDNARNYAEDY